MRGEENHHLLPWHAHLITKPTSHFLQSPQMPIASASALEEDSNDDEMEIDPTKSPADKIMVLVSNNLDGPITTVFKI